MIKRDMGEGRANAVNLNAPVDILALEAELGKLPQWAAGGYRVRQAGQYIVVSADRDGADTNLLSVNPMGNFSYLVKPEVDLQVFGNAIARWLGGEGGQDGRENASEEEPGEGGGAAGPGGIAAELRACRSMIADVKAQVLVIMQRLQRAEKELAVSANPL